MHDKEKISDGAFGVANKKDAVGTSTQAAPRQEWFSHFSPPWRKHTQLTTRQEMLELTTQPWGCNSFAI